MSDVSRSFFGKEELEKRFPEAKITERSPRRVYVEVDRAKKVTGISDVLGWEETDDPYSILVKELLPNEVKNIGIEPKMWFGVFQSISDQLSAKNFINAAPIFDSMRMVKDKDEIGNMQRAFNETSKTIIEVLYELEISV